MQFAKRYSDSNMLFVMEGWLHMTAMEIRAALLSKCILLIDIAKKCNASKSMVSNVVAGRRKSERIQMEIAATLGKGMEIWEVKAS